MAQTFTHKPPVTQGINNLADTIGAMLDARNQRMAMEQKAKMDAIKDAYDTFGKTVDVLKTPNLPDSIYEHAIDLNNLKVQGVKQHGINIPELPKSHDYRGDKAYKEVVKQLQALPKALESGAMGFTQMPDALNEITQNYLSGADDKKRALVQKMIADIQKDESNKQFGTLTDVISQPESMGNTPEEQTSIVQQMVGHLRSGDPDAAKELWKMWTEAEKSRKGYKFAQVGEWVGEDGNRWRTNPETGKPEIYRADKNGNYDWVYDPKLKPPQAVNKELGRPAAEVENGLSMIQTMKQTMVDIKDKMAEQSRNFGPVRGRTQKLNALLLGDKDFSWMMGNVGMMITLVYGLSGKQVADKEMERFNKTILPQMNDPNLTVEGKMEALDNYITRLYNNRLSNLRSLRYNVGDLKPMKADKYSFSPAPKQPTKAESSSTGRKPGVY